MTRIHREKLVPRARRVTLEVHEPNARQPHVIRERVLREPSEPVAVQSLELIPPSSGNAVANRGRPAVRDTSAHGFLKRNKAERRKSRRGLVSVRVRASLITPK